MLGFLNALRWSRHVGPKMFFNPYFVRMSLWQHCISSAKKSGRYARVSRTFENNCDEEL